MVKNHSSSFPGHDVPYSSPHFVLQKPPIRSLKGVSTYRLSDPPPIPRPHKGVIHSHFAADIASKRGI